MLDITKEMMQEVPSEVWSTSFPLLADICASTNFIC